MSKAAHKRRLDQLHAQAVIKYKPIRNIQEGIELFAELAADGIISAETLTTIYAKRSEKDFDPYECCTVEELRRMASLCE